MKKIVSLILSTVIIFSIIAVSVVYADATTLAADGTATRIEFESLSIDGMSTKTSIDTTLTGTFSGTGYAYQQNSVSGAATKTVTIPVTVTKAGTYTIDVHGSAYATKSDPANDNGHLSIKVGETEVPLTRNTTVLFGAKPSTTTYKAYSYVGEVDLTTDVTSIDLVYTFTGADKFKLVLDCIDFTNNDVEVEQEATPINVEFEDLDIDGVTEMTTISSGEFSGESYVFQMNSVGGAATKTVTIPVTVTMDGTYAIEVIGSAYAIKSSGDDTGSFAIKAGNTTVTLGRGEDIVFGALRNSTTYNAYSYTGEIELTTDTTSVELIYTFTGTDKYKLVLDCMSMVCSSFEDTDAEATPINIEFEELGVTGMSTKTAVDNSLTGTFSGTGYVYQMNSVAGAATKVIDIPVNIAADGMYSIEIHGTAYAVKSILEDLGRFYIQAGGKTVKLKRGQDILFGAKPSSATYEVYSYTCEMYLTTDITTLTLTYDFVGSDKYKLVLDCMSVVKIPDVGKVEVENVVFSTGSFMATITKNITLERNAKAFIAVYESETVNELKVIETINITPVEGILTIEEDIDVSVGNVIKLFIWDDETLEPYVQAFQCVVEEDTLGLKSLVTTFNGDATESRGIAWVTDLKKNNIVVRFAESDDDFETEYTDVVPTITEHENDYYYQAEMTGLEPGTEYVYRIGVPLYDLWSDEYVFTTAGSNVEEYSFLVFADTQGASQEDYNLFGRLVEEAFDEVPNAKFMLSLGDMVNYGYDTAHWEMYFNTLVNYAPQIPNMAIIGNHESREDYNTDYLDAGLDFRLYFNNPSDATESIKENLNGITLDHFNQGLLENIEGSVYSFDYGDVHYVALNSSSEANEEYTLKFIEAQTEWIEEDLASTDKNWIVLMIHQGVYPAKEERYFGIRDILEPIIDKYNVDLVLQGHDHMVSRTYPIRNGAVVSVDTPEVVQKGEGTVYFIPGSAGGKRYSTLSSIPSYMNVVINTPKEEPTYSVINVSTDKLEVITKDINGNVIDSFIIQDN